MAASETVSAYLLVHGDVIRLPGKEGWYVVASAFQEGRDGPMDLDLYRESDDSGHGWHAGHEEQVERRPLPTVLNLTVSAELAERNGRPLPVIPYVSRIGVRNRDGITPYSIAWAVWFPLESVIRMARSLGVPWSTQTAATKEVYAQPTGDSVMAWIDTPGAPRTKFPPIDISDIEMATRSRRRIPTFLFRRYDLSSTGPVAAPRNRS